jgi:hypothetical protein
MMLQGAMERMHPDCDAIVLAHLAVVPLCWTCCAAATCCAFDHRHLAASMACFQSGNTMCVTAHYCASGVLTRWLGCTYAFCWGDALRCCLFGITRSQLC